MSRYLRYIEQNEKWRGRKTDRHIIDSFISGYDLIYENDDHIPDPDAIAEFAKAASQGDYDILIGDPTLWRIVPNDTGKTISIPQFAVSGQLGGDALG